MRVYLSFLLVIMFIACGSGGTPTDKFDNKEAHNAIDGNKHHTDKFGTIYKEGASFTVKKGDSIISKELNATISVIRNMSEENSSITVISGSVSFSK